jgi:hypothetical protein
MNLMTVRLEIARNLFTDKERPLCSMNDISVSAFRYDSGIEALRLSNRRGEIVVLPFKGQQIWSAAFDGRDLTMKSMFDAPVATATYLETYGAFFIHCGLTGMGAPGPTDRHPLHGELPNAPFQRAWLVLDEGAETVTVGGSYRHTVAFAIDYLATSEVVLAAGSAMLAISLSVDNRKRTPMDLMYLAHANFRPVDDGELIYSAPYTAEAVRVRRSIPAHITPKPGYAEFLAALAADPVLHHRLKPGLAFDPEVAFSIDMRADGEGWAHALQRRPDGTADYIRYRPDQTKNCIRWICRTPDQDAIGMAFPSTSGVEGYTIEKQKGQVVTLPGGQSWRADMHLGALTAAETADVVRRIEAGRATR